LAEVRRLFGQARTALAFHGETKRRVGERLRTLPHLRPFAQLLVLLEVFGELAASTEVEALHAKPVESSQKLKEQQRLKRVQQFVAENYHRPVDMQEVVALCNLTHAAFCRYFRKMTQTTFTEFLNQYRINQAKHLLLQDLTVTEACYASGFENLSYFNKTFKKLAGENPMQFKKRYTTSF
jgi:AraC-like DNA-binding protein